MASHIIKKPECSICLEILRKPIRMLYCGHNFCQGCLHNLITSPQQNRCPICRKDINSNACAEDFPRNLGLENMIEEMNNLSLASTLNVVPKVKVLSGTAAKQLKDLARVYEQDVQLNLARGYEQDVDRLLKIGKLDKAVVSSVKLVSLLESTADQIRPIKDECDTVIYNLVKKFLQHQKFNVIFQLLQCRFNLLKRHYDGEIMLNKMCNISLFLGDVAAVVRSIDEIELFKKNYEFLDNILLFIQNSPTYNVTLTVKCENVASFLHNYGFACNEVKDCLKATMLLNQAIALRKFVYGNESNNCKNFANSYNILGLALENFKHLPEAKTAYLTSIEINKQARDYENEKKEMKAF